MICLKMKKKLNMSVFNSYYCTSVLRREFIDFKFDTVCASLRVRQKLPPWKCSKVGSHEVGIILLKILIWRDRSLVL